MVGSCSAYGCTNRWNKEKTRRFHRFPLKKPELLRKWLVAVRRADFHPTKSSLLCSDHFSDDCYYRFSGKNGLKRKYLKEDAVPDIFCFTSQSQKRKIVIKKEDPPLEDDDDDDPADAYWSEYEPLSPTTESIIRALNSTQVIHGSHSQSNERKEPDKPVVPRVVPLQVVQHLNRALVRRLNRKHASPTSLNDTNASYSTITAPTSFGTILASHSGPGKRKKLNHSVLTPVVPVRVTQHLNRPQAVRNLNCKLTSQTNLNSTSSPYSIIATSTNTVHGSHSPSNERNKANNASLNRNASLPIKQYFKNPQGVWRFKCTSLSPTDCLVKKSCQSTVTASTSAVTIHEPHIEIETHDAVLPRVTSSPSADLMHFIHPQKTTNVETLNATLPINQHLKYPLETTGTKAHEVDLTRNDTRQVNQHSQETASIKTDDAVLVCDESLTVKQLLNDLLETVCIKTGDTALTCDESLPVNQQLNYPRKTVCMQTSDAVLTSDESLPVNQELNYPLETVHIKIEDEISTYDESPPVNQQLNYLQETMSDTCEEFGKNVATKLRELPDQQRIICEKFINDALRKAKQGVLTLDHVLCKIRPSYYNYGYKARILARQIKSLSQNMDESVESSK